MQTGQTNKTNKTVGKKTCIIHMCYKSNNSQKLYNKFRQNEKLSNNIIIDKVPKIRIQLSGYLLTIYVQ